MQRVLLHGGHHRLAGRMHGDAGMAALPLQPPRAVHLGGHEPQRGAVVVRGGHPLALGVEGEAGDGGRMVELLQLRRAVEHVHRLADGAGEQPACRAPRPARPTSAELGESRRCRPRGPAERAVVAAGHEAVAPTRRAPAPRRHAPRRPASRPATHAACRRPARRRRAPARRTAATTKASSSRVSPRASSSERRRQRSPQAGTWHASNPRRSCGRLRLRPMNTRRERRSSPSGQGR